MLAEKVPTAFEKYVSNSRLAAPVGQNAPTGLRCSPSKSGDQYGGGRGSQRSSLNIGVLSESLPSRLRDASGSLLRLGGWQHLEGGCQPGLRPRLRGVTRRSQSQPPKMGDRTSSLLCANEATSLACRRATTSRIWALRSKGAKAVLICRAGLFRVGGRSCYARAGAPGEMTPSKRERRSIASLRIVLEVRGAIGAAGFFKLRGRRCMSRIPGKADGSRIWEARRRLGASLRSARRPETRIAPAHGAEAILRQWLLVGGDGGRHLAKHTALP
jgi:hypothetical protein